MMNLNLHLSRATILPSAPPQPLAALDGRLRSCIGNVRRLVDAAFASAACRGRDHEHRSPLGRSCLGTRRPANGLIPERPRFDITAGRPSR